MELARIDNYAVITQAEAHKLYEQGIGVNLELVSEETVTIQELVEAMRSKCLHCQRVPKLVRRPKEMTFLAKTPNEILHSDYV